MKLNAHLCCLLLAACAIVACSSGGGRSATSANLAPTLAAGALQHDGWRPPTTLPVTPVAVQYRVADPRFDALPGARAIFGEEDGAGYQIEIPDDWNGSVVYFAHGFRGNPPDLTTQAPPIREYLIRHGFAWAASSYTKNGYEPGAGARDTYALRDVFASKVAAPKRAYLYGQSMGGHVASLSLELYPTAYDGAFSECGVVSGHEILDYFISYGALAGYFAGADLTAAATDAGALGATLRGRIAPALGPYDNLTGKGDAFVDTVERLTGGPRPFFREGLSDNYFFNFAILVNAAGTAGPSNAAAQNADTTYAIDDGLGYTSDQINREIARVAANPAYRDPNTYPEFAPLTGKIQRPFLTLHNTGDLFVPISLEQSYRRIVDAAGAGSLLVQRAVRSAGHCGFTQEERERGFSDLVDWVEHGQKPAGEDLAGDLRDAGRPFTQPMRDNDPGGLTP
jgi:dienelactone hydrolase